MLMVILNVVFVLLAIAMIAMILMQRGAGAQAGSGCGAGASATVFGSRGASNFLSKSTKWLAVAFFSICLFMAWYASRGAKPGPVSQDLGVMAQVPAAPAKPPGTVPAAPAPQGGAPASTVPAAPAPQAPAATPAPQPAVPQPASGG